MNYIRDREAWIQFAYLHQSVSLFNVIDVSLKDTAVLCLAMIISILSLTKNLMNSPQVLMFDFFVSIILIFVVFFFQSTQNCLEKLNLSFKYTEDRVASKRSEQSFEIELLEFLLMSYKLLNTLHLLQINFAERSIKTISQSVWCLIGILLRWESEVVARIIICANVCLAT